MKGSTAVPNKTKPPKTLKIGARRYKVSRERNLINSSAQPLFGEHSSINQTIKLSDSMGPDLELDVFFHEIVHALHDHFDLPNGDVEEHMCTTLGGGLAALFIDNPAFVKYVVAIVAENKR